MYVEVRITILIRRSRVLDVALRLQVLEKLDPEHQELTLDAEPLKSENVSAASYFLCSGNIFKPKLHLLLVNSGLNHRIPQKDAAAG